MDFDTAVFLRVWLGYALFGVTAFSIVLAWAVRARQFSNLDKGRYIPLADERDSADSESGHGTRADRWGLIFIVTIALGLFGAAVVLATRGA
ncbi:MAG: hypothetical protein ACOX3G_06545 [Armatimonadota bacterium]|jgi:hypothetical protein